MSDIKQEAASKAKANREQMDKLKQTARGANGPATKKQYTYAQIAERIKLAETSEQLDEALALASGLPIDQLKELEDMAARKGLDAPPVEDDEVKPEVEAIEEPEIVDDPVDLEKITKDTKPGSIISAREVKKQLTTKSTHTSFFNDITAFEGAQRIAKSLCFSTLVPQQYQGVDNLSNTMIALEMAQRMNTSPLMVMQNLYIVHGKPGWSAQYVIASINMCKKFSPLRFEMTGEPGSSGRTCIAWARELDTGDRLESPPVSIQMAIDEGWFNKNSSKWKTMPEVMLRYRAASFFGKLYAPEIMMGMQTTEELTDIIDLEPGEDGTYQAATHESLDDLNKELLQSKTA